MITVKIPAAMRSSSPVACVFGNHADRAGVIADDYKHGDPRVIVAFRSNHDVFESIEFVEVGCLALIISDPTGAAHLAWWLQTQPKQAKQAAVNAMRIKGLDLLVVAEQAINGMPIDEAGLALLRDYAHRVAGVTNG